MECKMAARNDTEMEITQEEFNKIINNSHKIVVVDFFAEWCMASIMMTPIIEELGIKMKDIKFVKINREDNPEISCRYSVSSIPCLIVFKDGKEIGRIIGAHSYGVIERKIQKIMDEN